MSNQLRLEINDHVTTNMNLTHTLTTLLVGANNYIFSKVFLKKNYNHQTL